MSSRKRTFTTASTLFLLSLLIRLFFIAAWGSEEKIYDSLFDQYIYIDLAKNFVAGHGLSLSFDVFIAEANTPTSIQPPVYPLVLAGIFYFFGESYLAIRLLQVVLSSIISVVTFLIGKKVFDKSTALLAGLLTCVYPVLVMYTRPIMGEILYTFLLSLITFLLLKFYQEPFPPIYFFWWAILFGLAFLIRPEILVLAFLVGLFVLWRIFSAKPRVSFRYTGAVLGISLLAVTLVIGPWIVRNRMIHGEFLALPNKRWSIWEENWLRYMRESFPEWEEGCHGIDPLICVIPDFHTLSEVERDRYVSNLGRDFVLTHPDLFLRYSVSRFLKSYPIIPREEFLPPLGYKGQEQPVDGYHFTSLDDIPTYTSPFEKLRVWSFRAIFLLGVFGIMMALKERRWALAPLGLPLLFSVTTTLLLYGKERARLPIDPYLILFAAYGLICLIGYMQDLFYQKLGWAFYSSQRNFN